MLVAAALLGACASPPPPTATTSPPLPIPAAWPAGSPTQASASATVASDIAWTDFVADPQLRDLIDLALPNNRDLRAAIAAIEQARALWRVRQADELPTVSAGLILSRQPSTVRPGPAIASSALLGANISAYELDLFGRVRAVSDAAQAAALASEASRKTVQISLVAGVLTGALAIRADDEAIALTQRTLTSREESARLTQLKFDNGAASAIDSAAAQSLLEAARVSLAQSRRSRAQDENALALLLGAPVPAAFSAVSAAQARALVQDHAQGEAVAATAPVASRSGIAPLFAEIAAGLPADLLTRRPDIEVAERQLAAADANIAAARAAFWPKITLTTSLGIASAELSKLLTSSNLAWSLGAQALAPIFDHGRNQGNLAASQAARTVAVAQYEKAIQTAFREVADALAANATLADQLVAQQALVDAEATRNRLTDLRYRNGAASVLDALDAQRSLFAAQQTLVQTRLALSQARIALYKALGGGWTDPSATALARR
jgi:multidrug efflux system outer membrane protein